ncbi:hypothetical protein [Ralstonia edaphi]|uniref:hypothetical protein n=1 Tax=Ralstonia edaphi TaxID=3058599 RepID=UPI00292DEC9F|nr:hypothetical protein [Ralstonia sp. LMG 6871]
MEFSFFFGRMRAEGCATFIVLRQTNSEGAEPAGQPAACSPHFWSDTRTPGWRGRICLASALERPFHITESARKFSVVAVPFAENTFRIAKFVSYVVEK